jgi:putative membrane protein
VHPPHAHPAAPALAAASGPALALALLLGLCLLAPCAYLLGVRRAARQGRAWSPWRTAAFLGGAGLVLAALLPPLAPLAHHGLRAHMAQHLLLGMLGPVGLVLGAPASLALRALPRPAARALARLLRSRPLALLAHPVTALALNLGGMAALYLTPLFAALSTRPWLHVAVHVHFLAAGCAFSWAIAGVDPAPRRPSHVVRLWTLFAAMALHAALAKGMYAYGWPRGTGHSAAEREAAAQLMYYGGDLSELLLALALFRTWPRAAPGTAPGTAAGAARHGRGGGATAEPIPLARPR